MKTKRAMTIGLMTLLCIGLVAVMAGAIFIWVQHKQSQQSNEPTPEPPPMHTYVNDVMSRMSTRDKVASLFIFHTNGTDPQAMTAFMQQHKPSGMIFMGDNIPDSPSTLKALTAATTTDEKLPAFTAIDEEGGTVARLPNDTFASAETLRDQPPAATKEAFMQRSQLLKKNGFNLNFGVVADTTSDPESFIYPRVLGTTPEDAAERVKAAVDGTAGITLSTLKHFPGHGETVGDSHTSIPTAPTTFEDWSKRVAQPFKAGVAAGADLVMLGHLRYNKIDETPASLSKKWHDILQQDMKFEGLTITDDMFMLQHSGDPSYQDPAKNAIQALQAGNDLLLYVTDNGEGTELDPNALITSVTEAVERGDISKDQLDETVKKVLTLRHNLAAQ